MLPDSVAAVIGSDDEAFIETTMMLCVKKCPVETIFVPETTKSGAYKICECIYFQVISSSIVYN